MTDFVLKKGAVEPVTSPLREPRPDEQERLRQAWDDVTNWYATTFDNFLSDTKQLQSTDTGETLWKSLSSLQRAITSFNNQQRPWVPTKKDIDNRNKSGQELQKKIDDWSKKYAAEQAKQAWGLQQREIEGIWEQRIEEVPYGRYRVTFDAKTGDHTVSLIEQNNSVNGIQPVQIRNIKYDGETWHYESYWREIRGWVPFNWKKLDANTFGGVLVNPAANGRRENHKMVRIR